MSQSERVPVTCPSCSPGERVLHEVLSAGGQSTIRCTDCGHVHKERIETATEVDVDIVVSQDGESRATATTMADDETLATGDEVVVDTPEAIQQVRVTSIQIGDERRTESASASEIETLWTRAVDNVGVAVTVHPAGGDGGREESRSERLYVPGDFEVTVGDPLDLGDVDADVEGVQLRDEVKGDYRFEKLDEPGDAAFAKDIKRIYARNRSTTAWSAW